MADRSVSFSIDGFLASEAASSGLIVALGNFDGVHLGHTRLIREAQRLKNDFDGAHCAVWTFDSVGGPGGALSDTEERVDLLCEAGADFVILDSFERVRSMSPREFVSDLLKGSLNCVACVCGYNYRFGFKASGDPDLLTKLCREEGISVTVIPKVDIDGLAVSSTRIRDVISLGNVDAAKELIGRPFSYTLPVVHGNRIGHSIGFPTVNQVIPDFRVQPRKGVYATRTVIGGKEFRSITNVGCRPTVANDRKVVCETHIIGFDGDLYGSSVTVIFDSFLRDEKKFDSVELLKAQISADIDAALNT